MFAKLQELAGANYIKQLRNITEAKIYERGGKNIMSAVGKEDKDYKKPYGRSKEGSHAPHNVLRVVFNAIKACAQGTFACVLDDYIDTSKHQDISRKIFGDKHYTCEYAYVMSNKKLYKYNSQGLVEVLG